MQSEGPENESPFPLPSRAASSIDSWDAIRDAALACLACLPAPFGAEPWLDASSAPQLDVVQLSLEWAASENEETAQAGAQRGQAS